MFTTNYNMEMDRAIKGMLADLTDKVVDSFAAESAIHCGTALIRGTNPHIQVKPASTEGDGAKVIGIALHTHVELGASKVNYPQYTTVPVLTHGRVWVETDDAVVAGATANIKLSNGKFTDASVASGIEAIGVGAKFITSTSGAGLAIVEIG